MANKVKQEATGEPLIPEYHKAKPAWGYRRKKLTSASYINLPAEIIIET